MVGGLGWLNQIEFVGTLAWDWKQGRDGLIYGLLIGLFGGLVGGNEIISPNVVVIPHYALRLVIAFNNYLPFRLIPFLDYCVDRIFLRKVGGGYIFIHRLLMEHFAAMETATQ